MSKPTVLTIEETRQGLSEIARRASIGKERFVITFHGKPLCAIVPLEDLERPTAPVPPRIRRTRVRFND